MTSSTVAGIDLMELAGRLSEGERHALELLPTWGFPAGHNQWPDVEYVAPDDPDQSFCSGEDMNAIIRLGLAETGDRDEEGGIHLIDEDRECEARWPVDVTPLGIAVQSALRARSSLIEEERS